jgi:hypothetical protein
MISVETLARRSFVSRAPCGMRLEGSNEQSLKKIRKY